MALIVVSAAAYASALPPVLYYSDLLSGPGTGGQDNNGAIVTISGKHFGRAGADRSVSVGGGRAARYLQWSDTRISFQLGPAARVGAITVTTPEGTSNGLPFTVRSGNIYFVSTSSGRDPGSGTFTDPWRNLRSFYRVQRPGDICYIREGTYTGRLGDENIRSNIGIGDSAPTGYGGAEIAWVAYPGERVRIEQSNDTKNNLEIWGGKNYYVFAGFQMYSQDTCVELNGENNRIVNNSLEGVKRHAYAILHTGGDNNSKVYGNELFGGTSGSKLDHAVYVAWGTDNLDLGWNYIHGNNFDVGPAISVHTDGAKDKNLRFDNIRIHDNTIDCRGERPLRAIGISETATGSSVYIYNNVLIEPGSDNSYNFALYQYSGSAYICNNTLYDVKGTRAFNVTGSDDYRPEAVVVENNIFYNRPGCGYIAIEDKDKIGRVVVAGNCYYGDDTLPAEDRTPVAGDPLFINGPGGDFHLRPDSPCIGAGNSDTLTIAPRDRDGQLRAKGGTVDIGAYQFTGDRQAVKTTSSVPEQVVASESRADGVGAPARTTAETSAGRSTQEKAPASGSREEQLTVSAGRGETAKIRFEGETDGTYELSVFNFAGDQVYKETKRNVSSGVFLWSPGSAGPGTYIAYIHGPGRSTTKKITVMP
jgi:hypothetical protein